MSKFHVILFITFLFSLFSLIIWNDSVFLGIILILVISVCTIQLVKQCKQTVLEDPMEVICISSSSTSIITCSTISYYNHCHIKNTYTSCTMSTSTTSTFSYPTPITSTIPITPFNIKA